MAHLTSSPALHCARTVLKGYALSVKPPERVRQARIDKLAATESHVAILVDHASNVFRVVSLRPELGYWQKSLRSGTATAPQIACFVQKLLDAFGTLPQDSDGERPEPAAFAVPAQFASAGPMTYALSKCAREVSRVLFYYYDIAPVGGVAHNELDRVNMAKIAEATLGLTRAVKAVGPLIEYRMKLRDGKASEAEVRSLFRQVGVLFNYLPSYENPQEETRILY